jgi:hypothetical protein
MNVDLYAMLKYICVFVNGNANMYENVVCGCELIVDNVYVMNVDDCVCDECVCYVYEICYFVNCGN